MEFTNVISAYTEIGVLGLCAVLMIILFWIKTANYFY